MNIFSRQSLLHVADEWDEDTETTIQLGDSCDENNFNEISLTENEMFDLYQHIRMLLVGNCVDLTPSDG